MSPAAALRAANIRITVVAIRRSGAMTGWSQRGVGGGPLEWIARPEPGVGHCLIGM
jgi:hypothetical protein